MVEALYELLAPHLEPADVQLPIPRASDATTTTYLNRLTSLSLSSLKSTEPQSLAQSSQSLLRSLQALSKRSHQSIISSASQLDHLKDALPLLDDGATELQEELPSLDNEATGFAEKYSRTSENPILDRRKQAMLLAQSVDKVADVLDLPTLLSSAVSSSSGAQAATSTSTAPTAVNYASALDIHAHIKRIQALYPQLDLVASISAQAETEMRTMVSNLISGLQSQGVKLAGAMKIIGWLRRVAPDLDDTWAPQRAGGMGNSEGTLGAVFLVCRLVSVLTMLDALEPLRELADQETAKRVKSNRPTLAKSSSTSNAWSGGQQTERYLKRYIEIFREQSFAIISMYKSIFPAALPAPGHAVEQDTINSNVASPTIKLSLDKEQTIASTATNTVSEPLPSALATFSLHLVELLFGTLKKYLPNVQDRASRDSLLTQILYCSGSLGRLGGDFGLMLALLEDEDDAEVASSDDDQEPEWVSAVRKHRIQASRLELLASGVGVGRRESAS